LLLLICFTTLGSVFFAIGIVIDPLFSAFDIGTSEIAICGALTVISGVIGCLITGAYLDKSRKYLLTLKAICWGSTLLFIAAFTIYLEKNIYFIGTICIMIGLTITPILPLGSAFAGELTFPMDQAVIIGSL